MATKLVLTFQRELFNFLIINKNIFYTDRRWKSYVQCIPKPENFIQSIKMSRNKIPMMLINMFNLTEEELKEYESVNTEEELAEIIIKDSKLKGGRLMMRTKINNEELGDIKFIS